jgi:hypothetical protein
MQTIEIIITEEEDGVNFHVKRHGNDASCREEQLALGIEHIISHILKYGQRMNQIIKNDNSSR